MASIRKPRRNRLSKAQRQQRRQRQTRQARVVRRRLRALHDQLPGPAQRFLDSHDRPPSASRSSSAPPC